MTIRTLHRHALTATAIAVPMLLASGCAGTDFKLTADNAGDTAESTAQAITNMDSYMASLDTQDDTPDIAPQEENEPFDQAPLDEAEMETTEPYLSDADAITTTMATLEKTTVLASLTDTLIENALPATVDGGIQSDVSAGLLNEGAIEHNDEPTTETLATASVDVLPVSRPQDSVFHFRFDQSDLAEQDIETLKQHAEYLRHNPHLTLVIHGHTDNHGPVVYNQYLSEQRARKVAALIIGEGVPESQVQWEGLADTLPMTDPTQSAQNRRVELSYQDAYLVSNQQD